MKTCYMCGIEKEFNEFNIDRLRKDGRQSICRECGKIKKRAAYEEFIEWIGSLKKEFGCEFCGYNENPYSLEFHHLEPKNKERKIASMNNQNRNKVLREIEKCIVLCSNCHRELHAGLISLP